MRNFLILLFAIVIGIILGWLSRGCFVSEVNVDTKIDTTIVVDTNIYINPIPVTVEVNINEMITVPSSDIMIIEDSLIVLPMQTKTYEGKDYRCQVSGYQPSLDWIEVYPETKYITKETTITQRPKRWGLGIQAGYGVCISGGQIRPGPYIGIGVSYNLVRF